MAITVCAEQKFIKMAEIFKGGQISGVFFSDGAGISDYKASNGRPIDG
jgi:hypothetical protein